MHVRFRVGLPVLMLVAWAGGSALALSIAHDPVPFAVRGQALTLKAKVEGAAPPQSVTLYYALFRDAAPFRVPMKGSGLGYYVGTIEANLLGGVEGVSYYIEAQDESGALTETPWYEVKFRDPRPSDRAGSGAPPAPAPAGPAPLIPVPNSDGGGNWKTPALVAAGAAVVLAGAYALSDSGGGGADNGGGDDGGGDSSTNAPGTYAGTVTTCEQGAGQPTTCPTEPFTLLIDSRNVVFSETLRAGRQMTAPLGNNRFTLTAPVNEGGASGEIRYSGTWVNNSVVGQISGSATSAAGGIIYSGTFSADRQ